MPHTRSIDLTAEHLAKFGHFMQHAFHRLDRILAADPAVAKRCQKWLDLAKTGVEDVSETSGYLKGIKDALLGTDRNMRLANDKAQDVSLRRLTRRNPAMAKRFADLKPREEEGEPPFEIE